MIVKMQEWKLTFFIPQCIPRTSEYDGLTRQRNSYRRARARARHRCVATGSDVGRAWDEIRPVPVAIRQWHRVASIYDVRGRGGRGGPGRVDESREVA